jgi:hypothetical protein
MGPEVDENPFIGGRGDGAQHLSELASGEFARSTGAGNHLRETLGHSQLRSTFYVLLVIFARFAPTSRQLPNYPITR